MKDGVWGEETLDKPLPRDKLDLIKAAQIAATQSLRLEEFDTDDGLTGDMPAGRNVAPQPSAPGQPNAAIAHLPHVIKNVLAVRSRHHAELVPLPGRYLSPPGTLR